MTTNFEYGSNGDIFTANTGIFDAPMGGQLSSTSDVDVFKFVLSESARLGISFKLPTGATNSSYTISILDENGDVISTNSGGADFSNIEFSVYPGTYYFEIKANTDIVDSESNLQYFTTGQYGLTVKSLPAVYAQGEDYSKDNNFVATASDIDLGKGTPLVPENEVSTVIGNLTSVSDIDYFKFVTTDIGVYEFKFNAQTNVLPDEVLKAPDPMADPPGTIKEFFKISILDSAENVLVTHYVSSTPDSGFNFNFSSEPLLNPSGVYFVKIENGGSVNNINTQQYTFDINPVEPSSDNSALVTGGALVDYLSGGVASDIIKGNAGNDVISGLGGNDSLDGGLGVDIMKGGLGNDTYVVGISTDSVIENFNQGIDKVVSSVNYTLTANVENLVLAPTTTSATGAIIGATSGTGNILDNILVGNALANTLTGLGGNDTLDGGLGIKGDKLIGGIGDDTYYINNKLDVISESAGVSNGTDIALAKVDVMALANNVENLTLLEAGTNGDGSSPATYGVGNTLANLIHGNSASNQLSGLAGNDTIFGGGGNDAILGGLGNDILIGGTGSDLFVFEKALSATTNVDFIADFESGVDTIQLSKLIFAKLVGPAGNDYVGELSADNFHVGTAAADANDFIIYDSSTGDLFYDATGNAAGAAVLFANIGAGTDLAYTDFAVL